MTIFKTIQTYKTDAKPESFFKHGIATCFSFALGTFIYGFMTHMKPEAIVERIFFQSFAILIFCFLMSNSYKLYLKSDKVELEKTVKEETKETTFTF